MVDKLKGIFWIGLFWFAPGWLLAAPDSLAVKQNQVVVAVMGQGDFHPDRVVPGSISTLPDGLAARIIEQLSATNRFKVLERTALRRVVREQQFGREQSPTDLDRVVEKTVENLPALTGDTIAAAGIVANYNDQLKEFKDLGTTIGADYIVYAVLEKHQATTRSQALPFSESGRVQSKKEVDARLRLRVIATAEGRIVGADSIRTRISETAFSGKASEQDAYSMYDHLGTEASIRILDMIFPPMVVSTDPWVISRGSDQHVRPGDRFTLIREGKEIKDAADVVIGRLRSKVGIVEATQVQSTVTVVSLLEGEAAINDLAIPVKVAQASLSGAPSASSSSLPSTAPSAAPSLNPQATAGKVRPRLAVGLVKSRSTAVTGINANKHIPDFTDSLITRLTQTRRFQLIDRQEVDQLLDEQMARAMAENRDMPSAMGQLKGADYIVIGSVTNFSIDEKRVKLPGSSRIVVSQHGHVEGNMRIVDARSGEILESRKVSVRERVKQAASQQMLTTKLADAYADQVTVNLMNAVYPIKVAAVISGVAYINRGSDGGLATGEVLNLVRPGQAIIDPDTGLQLGVAETPIGTLTLASVEDARSQAAIGELAVQAGDILKRSSPRKGMRSTKTAPTSTRSGGDLSADAASADSQSLTLAIGKVRINPRAQNIISDQHYTARITNDLMIKISQVPEFDVMERDEVDQVIDEKAFTAIADESSIDGLMGELQGADYLISSAIDDFRIRTEKKRIPYTDEIQTRYYGKVEATARMIDVHTGKLVGAVKIRLDDRLAKITSQSMAIDDLIDRFSTELALRISEDLSVRKRGGTMPATQARVIPAKPKPKVNRPKF